jgi:hypothetical protein
VPRKRKQREGIQRVDVTGVAPQLWAKLQPKLIDAIQQLLETPVNSATGATVREEGREIASLAWEHVKERLRKDIIDNRKSEAEIAEIYERLEHEREKENRTRAETRKLNAEAEAQELDNRMRKLRTILLLAQATLAGQPGEEMLLMGRHIDAYLKAIEDVARSP